jgi:hypothetical protein
MWKNYKNNNEQDCDSAGMDFAEANALAPQRYHFNADFYDRFGCAAAGKK